MKPEIILASSSPRRLKILEAAGYPVRVIPPEMSEEKLRSILSEAKELGISFMVIAGGEPLVRLEILDIIKEFPEIIFLVFTNGLLIDEELTAKLKERRNLVPVISLEGYEASTYERRGKGVYERLLNVIKKIKGKTIFWATSLTVTNSNFTSVSDEKFIGKLVDLGCKLFFFLEYVHRQHNWFHLVSTHLLLYP